MKYSSEKNRPGNVSHVLDVDILDNPEAEKWQAEYLVAEAVRNGMDFKMAMRLYATDEMLAKYSLSRVQS